MDSSYSAQEAHEGYQLKHGLHEHAFGSFAEEPSVVRVFVLSFTNQAFCDLFHDRFPGGEMQMVDFVEKSEAEE